MSQTRNRALFDTANVIVAFGSVAATFTSVASGLSRVVRMDIDNTCNTAIEICLESTGTIRYMQIAASSSKVLDFGKNGVELGGSVFLKYATAPGSGQVQFSFMRSY